MSDDYGDDFVEILHAVRDGATVGNLRRLREPFGIEDLSRIRTALAELHSQVQAVRCVFIHAERVGTQWVATVIAQAPEAPSALLEWSRRPLDPEYIEDIILPLQRHGWVELQDVGGTGLRRTYRNAGIRRSYVCLVSARDGSVWYISANLGRQQVVDPSTEIAVRTTCSDLMGLDDADTESTDDGNVRAFRKSPEK